MGERGNLFKTVPVRFSLVNDQHINTLRNLERLYKETGDSRSQFIINAIEMYCNKTEGRDAYDDYIAGAKEEMQSYIKDIKEALKNEIRQELMKELLGVIAGVQAVSGGTRTADGTMQDRAAAEDIADDVSELEQNAGIVENAMKWG